MNAALRAQGQALAELSRIPKSPDQIRRELEAVIKSTPDEQAKYLAHFEAETDAISAASKRFEEAGLVVASEMRKRTRHLTWATALVIALFLVFLLFKLKYLSL